MKNSKFFIIIAMLGLLSNSLSIADYTESFLRNRTPGQLRQMRAADLKRGEMDLVRKVDAYMQRREEEELKEAMERSLREEEHRQREEEELKKALEGSRREAEEQARRRQEEERRQREEKLLKEAIERSRAEEEARIGQEEARRQRKEEEFKKALEISRREAEEQARKRQEEARRRQVQILVLARRLIPTDQLGALGLCPIFPAPDFKALPLMKVIRDGRLQAQEFVPEGEVECSTKYRDRTVIQLRGVNQGTLTKEGDYCPGLSMRSALQMQKYVDTIDQQELQKLFNYEAAKKFIQDTGCPRTAEKNVLENWIRQIQGLDLERISIINDVMVFDSSRKESLLNMQLLERKDFDEAQRVMERIRHGLQQPTFVHTFIVGNLIEGNIGVERVAQHWFCFVMLKFGNTIQYVVLDTLPQYHLHPNSYQFLRIKYFIDLLERGTSGINIMPGV